MAITSNQGNQGPGPSLHGILILFWALSILANYPKVPAYGIFQANVICWSRKLAWLGTLTKESVTLRVSEINTI